MKKVLAMLLALVMVMSVSAVAFAAGSHEMGSLGEHELDVVVNVDGYDIATVYSIVVEWTTLTFEYKQGRVIWDGEEAGFVYNEGSRAEGKNTATVTVTNKSNANVIVAAEVTNETGDFKTTLENASFDLGRCDTRPNFEPESKEIDVAVNLNVADDKLQVKSGSVGKIKVTISAPLV